MILKPTLDQGQTITAPEGKVIGFINGKAESEAFAVAVQAAGYAANKITSLYGEDGIRLLERLKENSFFFGDSEDGVIHLSIKELRLGHYAMAVEVTDHDQAAEISNLATSHGGHGFTYFGTWVSEQLSA